MGEAQGEAPPAEAPTAEAPAPARQRGGFDYSKFDTWVGEPQHLESGIIPDVEMRENAMGSIVHNLGHLNNLINTVFGNIEWKIADEARRLDYVCGQADKCRAGVDSIRGHDKATTVLSAVRFPAPRSFPTPAR